MIKFFGSLLASLAALTTALVLGIAIWAAAVRAEDEVVSLWFNPPVEIVGQPPQSQLINRGQERVNILVEGRESLLNHVKQEDFRAFIDLSELPYGDSVVEIQIQHDHPQVNIAWKLPDSTAVRLEQIVSREIPVRVELTGDVARGHIRREPTVDPVTIEVTGPTSRVDQLAEARITVDVTNQRQDVKVELRPTFYDLRGQPVTGLAGVSGTNVAVAVTVPIIESVGFAEKTVAPQWRGSPAPGYRLLNVIVQPPSVLVTGLPAALEKLRVLRTEPIDITGLVTSFTQQVPLELPAGISLDEAQPIIVTVEIEPILTSSIMAKEPDIRALATDLIAELDPEEVRIFLFGPLPVLDSLQQDDVRVTLDLLNLDVGVHNVIPIVDVFANEVEVRSFQPPFVTVTITQEITITEEITDTGRLPLPLALLLADNEAPIDDESGNYNPAGILHRAHPPRFAFKSRGVPHGY
jgi:YbbR domain-containing protein